MVTPEARRAALQVLVSKGLSQRAACRAFGVSRRVTEYTPVQPAKDRALEQTLRETAGRYPRFGYRRIAVMSDESVHRVWRLWHVLKLALPRRRPRRRRNAMDVRLPNATMPNSVWSYDFVEDRTASGSKLRLLTVLDEHTRECLAIEVARYQRSQDVILTLSRLMRLYGKPQFIRSDNGSEFTATAVMRWLRDANVGPAFIEPGKPWQNGFLESFHDKLRSECLNREWFLSTREAKVIIERWRLFYNHERPHSALGYKPPAKVANRTFPNHA